MKTYRVWLALPLVVILAVLFLVYDGEEEPADDRIVLDRTLLSDPESLDAQRARSTQAADVLRDIGEGLTGYTRTGELVPTGSTGWTVSEDGLVYRFSLRPEARWSNGDRVTAEHYVMGLRRLVDPTTAAFYAGQLGSVENAEAIIRGDLPPESLGVEAIDDLTLEIRLDQVTPYLLALLSSPNAFPVNPTALAEHGDAFARPGNLVSNGAYRLDAWLAGSLVQIERNPYYWDNANTAIDVVRYHVITQEMTELNRFRAGELHITSNVPPEAFEQVRREYPDELHVSPYLGIYYYGFNLTKPPFKDNLALRQALSMAVDREVLVERITGRGEQPAYSWVPPGMPDYEPPQFPYASLTQDERNAIARSLYLQAGYGENNPARIELRYNTNDTQQRIALAVQSMWKDVLGVETVLINEEFQVLLANMRDREVTQVFRSSWIGDFADPINFLGLLEPGAPSNMPGYESEEFRALLEDAAAQLDPQARRLFLEEAERVMLRDHPVLPLYFYVSKHLVSTDVIGWGDNILDYHYSQHLALKTGQ